MKEKHPNKMKIPEWQIKQSRYEYNLPQDEQQLIIDAIAYGHIEAIKDGIVHSCLMVS